LTTTRSKARGRKIEVAEKKKGKNIIISHRIFFFVLTIQYRFSLIFKKTIFFFYHYHQSLFCQHRNFSRKLRPIPNTLKKLTRKKIEKNYEKKYTGNIEKKISKK